MWYILRSITLICPYLPFRKLPQHHHAWFGAESNAHSLHRTRISSCLSKKRTNPYKFTLCVKLFCRYLWRGKYICEEAGKPEYRQKYLGCKVMFHLQYRCALWPSMLVPSPHDKPGVAICLQGLRASSACLHFFPMTNLHLGTKHWTAALQAESRRSTLWRGVHDKPSQGGKAAERQGLNLSHLHMSEHGYPSPVTTCVLSPS
jgi:hypothetical protein